MNRRRGAGPGRPPARASREAGPVTSALAARGPSRPSRAPAGRRRLLGARAEAQVGEQGRGARMRGRLQWRQRRRQRRRNRQRRRQRRRDGAARRQRERGRPGAPPGRHAPRLRAEVGRDGSRARVLASRGVGGAWAGAGRAWEVTWAVTGRCCVRAVCSGLRGLESSLPCARPKRPTDLPRRGPGSRIPLRFVCDLTFCNSCPPGALDSRFPEGAALQALSWISKGLPGLSPVFVLDS